MDDDKIERKSHIPPTGVWQKSGFSGYLNILPRINFCAGLTVQCFDIRFFAKRQNVSGKCKKTNNTKKNGNKFKSSLSNNQRNY